ncbi:MAG: TetR/AcrR family transcriptional regulator [Clostridium sp.]|nr:TetR/AcrR family transcriptional regulator [Clostridium sp.]
MNIKDNQRIRLSKMLFKNSLIALLKKKPVYQISVTELCEKAELNRSTFYKYYGNVRDVLTEIEKETLEQGQKCMQEIEVSGINYAIQPLYRLLCYIKENKELYQMILNNSADDNFSSVMIQDTIDFLKSKCQNILDDNNNFSDSDYIFQYILSGCIRVIQSWLNSSMTESPKEIAQLIYTASVSVIETYK